MPPIIAVNGLGKRYLIGGPKQRYKTLRESLVSSITTPAIKLGRLLRGDISAATGLDQEVWALRDVDFDVDEGEVVGLVGHNGAGKTTLLKLLARITAPSAGRAEIRGRVGSLLEVGTGFHPELTGRDNVFLNGAILGMSRREIQEKFDEIVAFAEVEKFLDTPVKFYSSGMNVRLAFAVAAHLEPEILFIDEVLAVGDASFQRKCLGKMSDVSRLGRTILFVSHNMVAVRNLCSRVIWLDHGTVKADGPTAEVVADYLRSGLSDDHEQSWDDSSSAPGNEELRLRRVAVSGSRDSESRHISSHEPMEIIVDFTNTVANSSIDVNFHLLTADGAIAFVGGTIDHPPWHASKLAAGAYRCVCTIPANLLNHQVYEVTVQLVKNNRPVVQVERAVSFQVQELRARTGSWHGRVRGAVRPRLSWSCDPLGPTSP